MNFADLYTEERWIKGLHVPVYDVRSHKLKRWYFRCLSRGEVQAFLRGVMLGSGESTG